MELIAWPEDLVAAGPSCLAVVGGKARGLASLGQLGLRTPAWFCVAASEFRRTVTASERVLELVERGGQARSGDWHPIAAELRREVLDLASSDQLRAALEEGWERLGGVPVAVRSSAVDEDGASASMAGMYESVLDVRSTDELVDAVRSCWASAFGDRAIEHRLLRGMDAFQPAMAVVVQELVPGRSSGVCTTRDPATGEHVVFITSTWGLGAGVVSGELEVDVLRRAHDGSALDARIAVKDVALMVAGGGGIVRQDVPADRREVPSLTDEEASRIAAGAILVELAMGGPCEVEWTVDSEGPAFLQARALVEPVRPSSRISWSNDSTEELLGGIVSPLTYSLASRGITVGMTRLAQLLGAGPELELPAALGHINHRVYLNENAWHAAGAATRVGADLRGWFGWEPEEPMPRRAPRLLTVSMLARVAVTVACAPLLFLHGRRRMARMAAACRGGAGPGRAPSALLSAVACELERIGERGGVVDAGVVILEGMLTRRCSARGIAVPDVRATWVPPHVREAGSIGHVGYVKRYGHRLVDGLKLESGTLADHVTVEAVGQDDQHRERGHGAQQDRAGMATDMLAWGCRRLASYREQLGWLRAEGFAAARNVVLERAAIAVDSGRIEAVDDIFLLEYGEVLTLESDASTSMRAALDRRRAAMAAARLLPPLPTRFVTEGIPTGPIELAAVPEAAASASSVLEGIGAAPGRCRGRVCRVDSLSDVARGTGAIVVCERLSPELVVLLRGAFGIIVERGSPLAHAVIIARELGMPVVVGAARATTLLREGDEVELDGAAGIVRVVAPSSGLVPGPIES